MDARNLLTLLMFPVVSIATAGDGPVGNLRTRNFVVTAPNQQLASQIGFAAEKFRRQLAIEWLGREIPEWRSPCVITARIKPQAFGETSFSFSGNRGQKSQPFDFVMEVNGSAERILDSVLPHEVSHTIFASHFGQPLPRWADEGACTTVEHVSERKKNHRMLIEFLTTNRGIPFNRMFAMKNYPRDILPLYAQGYSLCRFLIQRGGKRKFIKFMDEGLASSDWNSAVKNHYQINDLSRLQTNWLEWVKGGCPLPNSDQSNLLVTSKNQAAPPQTSKSLPFQSLSSITEGDQTTDKAEIHSAAPTQLDSKPQAASKSSGNFYLNEIDRMKSRTMLR